MAITQTLQSPPVYSSAYNPIIWMVASDETQNYNFKYIFDVYIGGATGAIRFKTPANPAGRGIIDVSALIQNEIIITDNLPMLSGTPFYGGTGLAGEVYILAGEEYSITLNGEVIQYNGLGGTGSPAYGLYADGNFRPAPNSVTPVVALAWGQGANLYYDYLASGGEDVLVYEMALGQVANTGGKFLTRCPQTVQSIRSDETFTLSWLNYNFEAATEPQTFPYAMKVTTFLGGATVGATGFLNIEANGGNWTSCTTFGTGPTAASDYLNAFKINMADVQNEIPGAFDTVTLQLFPYETYGTCTLGATGLSETITLQIDDTNCWGFEPIRFTWLNNLGGRDWYTFIKRNTFTQNASRNTFYKLPGYWSASTYSVQDSQPARYGTTTFRMDLTNSWTASTNWLTEEESNWLRSMFASPHVIVYLPGRSQPTLINITDADYSVQNFAREKLFQYFVSFTEAQPDVVQGF
jgi:hypothetical protein